MSKQLTMKAGVAMFAALALAVALAILAFAYQPVGAQTTSDHVARSFSATQVTAGGTVDVTITLNTGFLVKVTETLPDGWTYQSVMPSNVDVTENGQMITFDVLNGEPVTYTVMAPSAAGSGTFSGMYAITGTPNITVGGLNRVSVVAVAASGQSSNSIKGGAKAAEVTLSDPRPGATNVTMTITFETRNGVDNTPSNGDSIRISIPHGLMGDDFTLPTNFSKSHVAVTQGGNTVGMVSINDSNQIVIGPGARGGSNLEEDQMVTVMVSGLTNPATPGTQRDVDIGQQESTDGPYINVSPAPDVTVYDPAKSFTNACAKLVDGNLVVEFRTRRDHDKDIFNVAITPDSGDFAGIGSASAVVIDNNDAASDMRNPALPSNFVVTNYDMGETNTVTISGLSDPFGFTGDRLVKIAEGTGYEGTLVVDGPCFLGPGGVTDDDTMYVLGSNNKADTATAVKVRGNAVAAIRGGRNISVSLPGFHVPASIGEAQILIDGNLDASENDDYYGNPGSVSVSGTTITLSLPARMANPGGGTGTVVANIDGDYTILFKQGAGLKTPNSAGTKTITVQDLDPATANHKLMVKIISHISVDSSWVRRGQTFTVTAKGVNAIGDTTAHLYSGIVPLNDDGNPDPSLLMNEPHLVESASSLVLGRGPRDGGTVIVEGISTTRSEFIADAKNADAGPPATDARGVNLIVMVDAAGNNVGHTYLGILPSVSLDVTDVRRTGEVVVKVSDWYYGDRIDLVRINGILVNLPDNTNKPNDDGDEPDSWVHNGENHEFSVNSDQKAEFTVVVDRDTRLGEMQVDLRGKGSYLKQGSASTPDIHKQTVQVGFFPLTLTPSTAVTEQVMQIEGEEFLARACITSISVGERTIDEATNGDTIGADTRDCVDTDSNGKLTATFRVPRGLNPGTYSVVVRDSGNRVGEAKLEIPEPEIDLDPMTSQRGSTVTVVGKNFPADDVVTIDYRGVTVEAAQTDTVGNFRATFQVPITAPIGADHEVLAASENKADGKLDPPQNQPEVVLTAKRDHHVSDETLSFDREKVAPGEQLGIISTNLPLFTPVSIVIGDRAVAGKVLGEDNASDGFGEYRDSVLVPQLPPGITIVELTVHTERGDDVRVAEFVEITNIITRPTDEVFSDLIAAGQLESVWRYQIDETGSDWDSFDPQYIGQEGINDLELVSTNDIVWIRVNANVTFQGAPLFAGWNLRTLE